MQASSPWTVAAFAVTALALLVPAADAASTRAKVIRVVDADSVRVSVAGTTRTVDLLGVDAPVGRDCFAAEASTALRRLLPRGAAVRLSTDGRRRGVYVRRAGRLVNATLIAGGFATADRVTRLRSGYRLSAAEARAKAAGRGRWSACVVPPAQPANPPAAVAPVAPPVAPVAPAPDAATLKLTSTLGGGLLRRSDITGLCSTSCITTDEAFEYCTDGTFSHEFRSAISVVLPDPIDPVERRDVGTWRVRSATIEPGGTLNGTIEVTLQSGSAITSGTATPGTVQTHTVRIFTDGIALVAGAPSRLQASRSCA